MSETRTFTIRASSRADLINSLDMSLSMFARISYGDYEISIRRLTKKETEAINDESKRISLAAKAKSRESSND